MEEFKALTPTSSVVKLSACLEKIYKKIYDSCEKKIPEHSIKEIEFLKSQCRAENVQLSVMACQTFVRLVEDDILESGSVLPMLLSMLPNSK